MVYTIPEGALPKRPTGPGLLTTLCLFAIICGFILLFNAADRPKKIVAPEVRQQQTMEPLVANARRAAQGARAALAGQNYGAAAQELEILGQNLLLMQHVLDGAKGTVR